MEDKDMEIKEKEETVEENIVSEDNESQEENKSLEGIGIEIIDVDEDEYNKKKKPKTIFGRIHNKIKEWKKNKIVAIVWQLVSSLLLLALAGGIGIFVAVGQMRGGPKVFAEEYFEYYMNNNWYNMYQKTEITESKFINFKTFAQMMSQNAIDGNVTDYEVIVDSRSGDYATVRVKYNMNKTADATEEITEPPVEETVAEETPAEETPAEAPAEETAADETPVETPAETQPEETEPATVKAEGTYTMTLKRQPKNILLVYSTWKGWMDSYIIKDCTIEVPDYAKVTFDGIDVSDCLTGTNEETGNAVYSLDRVFMGHHIIKIEGESIDTITETVLWEKNNEKYELVQSSIPIKAEHLQNMQKKSVEILQAYYASGLSDGSADGIKPLFRESEEAYAHIDEQIKALYNEINHEDGRTLISMEITSLRYEITDFVYNDSVTVNMIYDVNYSAKKGRTAISGYRKNYNGANTAIAAVYFKYIDGQWHPVDSSVTCVDYTLEAEQ